MKQRNKGITLIALIITVIVMLILAGVAINLTIGDNGIFAKTKITVTEHRGGAVEEQRDLWRTDIELHKEIEGSEVKSLEELLEELRGKNLLTDEEVEIIKKDKVVTIGSHVIDFSIKKNPEEAEWKYEGTYTTPLYPSNYPNNSNVYIQKAYGEEVKAIKIDITDSALEGGCNYDYGLIYGKTSFLRRICDATQDSFIVGDNFFNFIFRSDGSVTRRGISFDVYTTTEDVISQPFASERKVLWNLESTTEQQKVSIQSEKKPKLSIPTTTRTNSVIGTFEQPNTWSIPLEENVDPDATITISNVNGEVLYTQEIHEDCVVEPNLESYPEEIIVTIERRAIDAGISVEASIDVTYEEE